MIMQMFEFLLQLEVVASLRSDSVLSIRFVVLMVIKKHRVLYRIHFVH